MSNFIKETFYDIFYKTEDPKLKLVTTILSDYDLFHIAELNVNNNETEIESYINERYQTLLTSCYFSNISVVKIFSFQNGKTKIFFGFKQDNSTETATTRREIYLTILKHNLSFKVDDKIQNTDFLELTQNTQYSGIICSNPLSSKEDKFKFNIGSILKGLSLNNKKTLIAIFSKPIEKNVIEKHKNRYADDYYKKPEEFIRCFMGDQASSYMYTDKLWREVRGSLINRLELGVTIGFWET